MKPENSLLRLRIIDFTLSNARRFYDFTRLWGLLLWGVNGLRDIFIIYEEDDRVGKKKTKQKLNGL